MINPIQVGHFLTERRTAVGLTQEELAERLGVTRQAVSKWENGISLPDAGLLRELSTALSTTVESLLAGAHDLGRGSRDKFPVVNATETSLAGSKEAVGYQVKIMHKAAFQVAGFSAIIPPDDKTGIAKRFAEEAEADGRVGVLRRASSEPAWILGLGSWDRDCEPTGWRYTVCIEETENTDLRGIDLRHKLFRQCFERCDWMCFELSEDQMASGRFWKDNPYTMLRTLGYRFHIRVGVHFDARPPDHDARTNPGMEFWISVAEETADCGVCRSRAQCAEIQAFG